MDRFVVKANGQKYEGWKTMRVSHALELGAAEIELGVVQWQELVESDIALEDEVTAFILDDRGGAQQVFGGWLEAVEGSEDDEKSDVSLTGRSYAAALIDEPAPLGGWQGLDLLQLLRSWATPLGIAVNADVDVGEGLPMVRPHPGEMMFEVAERMARKRGIVITSGLDGSVLLTAASDLRTDEDLVDGQNIKKRAWKIDMAERRQRYIARGLGEVRVPGRAAVVDASGAVLVPAGPDDTDTVSVSEETIDPGVRRLSTLLITGESELDNASALTRTRVEAARRIGQSIRATYTVVGWRQWTGRLWEINRRVRVIDDQIGWRGDEDLLIVGVTFGIDEDGGYYTELVVVPRIAFALPSEALQIPSGLEGAWSRVSREARARVPARVRVRGVR